MARWDPVRMERSTRDIIAVAIWTEIQEGRGGPHGGVFVSLKHLPDNLIEHLNQWLPPKYLDHYGGFDMTQFLPDLTRSAVESVPGCHFFNGGIKIDSGCHTNLPGLYAAGEVTAGIHGGNRLSGNAFTEMVVWGHRAAVSMAEDIRKGIDPQEIDQGQVDHYQSKMSDCLNRKSGANAELLRDQLMKTAWDHVGIVRNRELLSQAQSRMKDLQKAGEAVCLPYKGKIYNRSWSRALEFKNMADNLTCIVEAALLREESRGAHYRKDFPQTDNQHWVMNQILCRKDGRPAVKKVPPCMTSIRPAPEIKGYGI